MHGLRMAYKKLMFSQALLWLSKLGADISIWWAYSVPPEYNRVEVEAKTWWGPVTMPTGAPVESRSKKDLNLQIHIFHIFWTTGF